MKKILFFRGGWDGHDPFGTSELVAKRLSAYGFECALFDSMECLLDPALKSKYSLIVPCWTMGEIGSKESNALLEAIQSGVSLAGWHGGMGDAFRNNTDYQFMCGGQWVAHPGNFVDYTVNIVDKNHPVTAGISDFSMHSEQYYMHTDPGNHVLASTTFDGSHSAPWIAGTVMPVAWTRHYGKGKVFYSSLGHNAEDFLKSPNSLNLLIQGILWALED